MFLAGKVRISSEIYGKLSSYFVFMFIKEDFEPLVDLFLNSRFFFLRDRSWQRLAYYLKSHVSNGRYSAFYKGFNLGNGGVKTVLSELLHGGKKLMFFEFLKKLFKHCIGSYFFSFFFFVFDVLPDGSYHACVKAFLSGNAVFRFGIKVFELFIYGLKELLAIDIIGYGFFKRGLVFPEDKRLYFFKKNFVYLAFF